MRGSVSPGLFPAIFPRLIAPFPRGIGSFSGERNPQIAQPNRGVNNLAKQQGYGLIHTLRVRPPKVYVLNF
ncbi:hypothetical protein SBA3_220013 [Candidatus Sulfopaludibacter sp. SbA3]|nr:hypothetical protein SBA3_220013 [Candidatus Sulfopaludibacter sp. SbA3]